MLAAPAIGSGSRSGASGRAQRNLAELARLVEQQPRASTAIDKARADFEQEAVWAVNSLKVLRMVADCKGAG